MATNGSAIRVMREPKIEMVAADQTRTNAPLRHRGELNGRGTAAATTP